MDSLLIAGGALAAFALVSALALFIPAAIARPAGIAAAMTIIIVFAQNPVPQPVRIPALFVAFAILLLGDARAQLRGRGSSAVLWVSMLWWGLVGIVSWFAGTYGFDRFLLQIGVVSALLWVTSRLTGPELRWLLNALLAVWVVVVVCSAVEFAMSAEPLWGFAGGILRDNPFIPGSTRAQATFAHPIVFGYFSGAFVVLAWANPTKLASRTRIPLLAVSALGLVLSGTRSAALAAGIAIVVHILMRFRIAQLLRGLLLLLVVIAAASIAFGARIGTFIAETLESGSWIHRLGSMEAIPSLLERTGIEYWFGSGYGSEVQLFSSGYIHLTFGLAVVDNFVVYVLGTMGVVGIVATIALVAVPLVLGDRYVKASVCYVIAMFISFDTTVWLSSGFLMFFALGLAGASRGGEVSAPTSALPATGLTADEARRVDDGSRSVAQASGPPSG